MGEPETPGSGLIARRLLCSGRLQASICFNQQCPPEGGLYKSEKFALVVVVIPAVISAMPTAAMFLWRPASFSCRAALAI